jgi:hypothetical protein
MEVLGNCDVDKLIYLEHLCGSLGLAVTIVQNNAIYRGDPHGEAQGAPFIVGIQRLVN